MKKLGDVLHYYMPHGVEMLYNERLCPEKLNKQNKLTRVNFAYYFFSGQAKPILRPLSELKDQVESWLESDFDHWCYNYQEWVSAFIDDPSMTKMQQAPFEIVEWCLRNHYDIFGLTESGQAVKKE